MLTLLSKNRYKRLFKLYITMRKLFLISLLMCFGTSFTVLGQRMSDEKVIEYAKKSHKEGKDDKQIAVELAKQGVTKEQAERIKKQYKAITAKDENKSVATVSGRSREPFTLPVDSLKEDSLLQNVNKDEPKSKIFGHNIFSDRNLSFEPSANIATPKDYILGPGDEIIIDIWGASENNIREVISPDGAVNIENIGPVYLNGMTIQEANNFIQKEFSKIYSGISGNTSQIQLTLGQNRSIQINILGEVKSPGTYTLSSFASVFHALYAAGGVNEIGSMRDIRLVRNNKSLQTIDLYEFILKGKTPANYKLQEGDIILIPAYDNLVKLNGYVKRPMYYEMRDDETLMTLLKYSGGFTGDAFQKNLKVFRNNGFEQEVSTVDFIDFSTYKVQDQDSVVVGSVLDRFANAVKIRGAVYRPGIYELSGKTQTIKDIIEKAEGLRGDVFLNRIQIQRENADLTKSLIAVNLQDILSGEEVDIPLHKNDVIYIPSIHDLNEVKSLTIHGEVANPGTYDYADKTTIEDLIIQAGGLLESASAAKIDIARRKKDPYSISEAVVLGESFSLDLSEDYDNNKKVMQFYLQPFDEVYVRRSPAYETQKNVIINGEVLFAGSYALTKKNQRVSDLIKSAGGLTSDAFTEGARLVRRMNREELARKEAMLTLAEKEASNKDSIDVSTLELDDTYSVGIDLAKALNKPKSSYDLVLREGDMLYIPQFVNTVKINGAVMYPNTVLYQPGKKLSYYINQAGGYGNRARKSRVYAVYLNGEVSRLKGRTANLIQPGCEIVIPTKEERKRMSTGEVISIGSSVASLAAVIVSMVQLFK